MNTSLNLIIFGIVKFISVVVNRIKRVDYTLTPCVYFSFFRKKQKQNYSIAAKYCDNINKNSLKDEKEISKVLACVYNKCYNELSPTLRKFNTLFFLFFSFSIYSFLMVCGMRVFRLLFEIDLIL